MRRRGVTDFDGGDAEAAGFEDNAYAARRHAFAEPAHHTAANQHVLHLLCAVQGGELGGDCNEGKVFVLTSERESPEVTTKNTTQKGTMLWLLASERFFKSLSGLSGFSTFYSRFNLRRGLGSRAGLATGKPKAHPFRFRLLNVAVQTVDRGILQSCKARLG